MTIKKTNKQALLTDDWEYREERDIPSVDDVSSVDVVMLFCLDVVIVLCVIKLFFNVSFGDSMPQGKDIYELVVSLGIVNNLLARDQMTAFYKKQKRVGVSQQFLIKYQNIKTNVSFGALFINFS